MIYGPEHCRLPAHVYDVDRIEQITQVLSVDADTGEVEYSYQPARLNHDRTEVETFRLRFQTIYPIFGGDFRPTLFHCYGRLPA